MNDYKICIDACLECARACEMCAHMCLEEEDVQRMKRCILLDHECSAICFSAAKVMAMSGESAKKFCLVCAEICRLCAEECSVHQSLHCQQCAEACMRCAAECRKVAA